MEKEWGYIALRMHDGTWVIYGGYNLFIGVEEDKLVVQNSLIEIRLKPPVSREEVLNTIKEVRQKFGDDAADKLSMLLKSLPITSLSD